jgi:phospho-N-acetylmuramoyl-pentapeptide-transferase
MKLQIIYLLAAFIVSAVLEKLLIPVLKKLKVGQSERNDGPRSHLKKQGTPTMGGIAMILTMIIFMIIFCIINRNNIDAVKMILAVGLTSIGFGLIGFIDDFKKVILKNTEGLNPKLKMFGLLIIATAYTMFLVKFTNIGTGILIPFFGKEIVFPLWLYIPFTIFVMLGTTNAVNLTDGVDGLNGSVSTIMMTAMAIISLKLGNQTLSILSSILAGSCIGFLVYNFHPAKVFMGDTGSIFLGGALASIAIYLRNPLILIIVAIIPVLETLSDIIQVASCTLFGKRVFKMAPLHHHFELSGWRESKVVGVFALVTFIASIIGILAV